MVDALVPEQTEENAWQEGLGADDRAVAPGVAVLVDYPVLLRAVRATDANAVPKLAELVRRAGSFGGILSTRAYGAWYDVDEALAAFNAGLTPVYVAPAGPGSVPTTAALVAEGMALIREGQVQALVLCGDDRLLPLVTAAHDAGIAVHLVAHNSAEGSPCLELADSEEPASEYVRAQTRAEKYRRPARAAAN